MWMLDDGREDGRWTMLAVGFDWWVAPFKQAPAVVAAALHAINHLPQFPPHIAHPKVARLAVEAHPPGVAQAVGPHLRARARRVHKRIIRRDAVRLPVFGVIDIDTQYR